MIILFTLQRPSLRFVNWTVAGEDSGVIGLKVLGEWEGLGFD